LNSSDADEKSPLIGTLSERSLHAALKDWYEKPGDRREVKVDGYVIDLIHEETLIEIQTRSFAPLRTKLAKLTRKHPVRLVHPIAAERWIVKLAADGETLIERRKSPRRGRIEHIFLELVSIPHLVERDNFSLDVLLTQEEEVRIHDGKGSWRRKGWSILDRRLLDVVQRVTLSSVEDYRALVPPDLPAEFTTRDLAKAIEHPIYVAQKMAYCLRKMDAIQVVGKKGNSILYSL
jgi:hypothetical protein